MSDESEYGHLGIQSSTRPGQGSSGPNPQLHGDEASLEEKHLRGLVWFIHPPKAHMEPSIIELGLEPDCSIGLGMLGSNLTNYWSRMCDRVVGSKLAPRCHRNKAY